MKRTCVLALLLTLAGGLPTYAQQPMYSEDQVDRNELKAALQLLINSGVITFPPNTCPVIDSSLLRELRDQGLLKPGTFTTTSVCIDAAK